MFRGCNLARGLKTAKALGLTSAETLLGHGRRGDPVADDRRSVMSGSTSSGPGPNCQIDEMGQKPPFAMQKKGPCTDASFAVGLGAAVALP